MMTDAVQGDPPDGRQVLSNVPCLRSHAVTTNAVVINCDDRQLLCIVPCLRNHAVMTDAVQWVPLNGQAGVVYCAMSEEPCSDDRCSAVMTDAVQ